MHNENGADRWGGGVRTQGTRKAKERFLSSDPVEMGSTGSGAQGGGGWLVDAAGGVERTGGGRRHGGGDERNMHRGDGGWR